MPLSRCCADALVYGQLFNKEQYKQLTENIYFIFSSIQFNQGNTFPSSY